MTRERWLTPTDRRLLAKLRETRNLARAAREIGIGRDRAVYRLRRMERLYGGPVVIAHRGGPSVGGSRLTALGRRILRAEGDALPREAPNRWSGTYREGEPPRVVLGRAASLEVAFPGRNGSRIAVEVDPEAFLVARGRFDSSARNVLAATITAVTVRRDGRAILSARWGGRPVRVAMTAASAERLGLAPGRSVFLYLKAVAIRAAR